LEKREKEGGTVGRRRSTMRLCLSADLPSVFRTEDSQGTSRKRSLRKPCPPCGKTFVIPDPKKGNTQKRPERGGGMMFPLFFGDLYLPFKKNGEEGGTMKPGKKKKNRGWTPSVVLLRPSSVSFIGEGGEGESRKRKTTCLPSRPSRARRLKESKRSQKKRGEQRSHPFTRRAPLHRIEGEGGGGGNS